MGSSNDGSGSLGRCIRAIFAVECDSVVGGRRSCSGPRAERDRPWGRLPHPTVRADSTSLKGRRDGPTVSARTPIWAEPAARHGGVRPKVNDL
jgi:hypothetical protein